MTTITNELREKLKPYPLAKVAELAELGLNTVAEFMDGGSELTEDDMFKLIGAMLALKRGDQTQEKCQCPKCSLLREIATSIPGAKFKDLPGGGGMLEITTITRSTAPETGAAPKATPKSKASIMQRLKRVFE